MNPNILQFMQAMRNGQNPQTMMISMLESRMGNTPIGQNLLQMAKSNDGKGIENFARNLCAQRGLNFDTEFAAFKRQLGL